MSVAKFNEISSHVGVCIEDEDLAGVGAAGVGDVVVVRVAGEGEEAALVDGGVGDAVLELHVQGAVEEQRLLQANHHALKDKLNNSQNMYNLELIL